MKSNAVAESVLPELSSMGKEEGKNPTWKSSCVRDVVTKYTAREPGTRLCNLTLKLEIPIQALLCLRPILAN